MTFLILLYILVLGFMAGTVVGELYYNRKYSLREQIALFMLGTSCVVLICVLGLLT